MQLPRGLTLCLAAALLCVGDAAGAQAPPRLSGPPPPTASPTTVPPTAPTTTVPSTVPMTTARPTSSPPTVPSTTSPATVPLTAPPPTALSTASPPTAPSTASPATLPPTVPQPSVPSTASPTTVPSRAVSPTVRTAPPTETPGDVLLQAESAAVSLRRIEADPLSDRVVESTARDMQAFTREINARLDESARILADTPSVSTLENLAGVWTEVRRDLAARERDLALSAQRLDGDAAALAQMDESKRQKEHTLRCGSSMG